MSLGLLGSAIAPFQPPLGSNRMGGGMLTFNIPCHGSAPVDMSEVSFLFTRKETTFCAISSRYISAMIYWAFVISHQEQAQCQRVLGNVQPAPRAFFYLTFLDISMILFRACGNEAMMCNGIGLIVCKGHS